MRPPISLLGLGTRIRTFATKRFLQEIMDALRERGFTNVRKAQLQSWYYFSAGHAQRVQYGATFVQEKRARIEVYIDNTDRDWNKILFDRLMERKESIESELSESLELGTPGRSQGEPHCGRAPR